VQTSLFAAEIGVNRPVETMDSIPRAERLVMAPGVDATARDAVSRGEKVIVAGEACATASCRRAGEDARSSALRIQDGRSGT
jgi:hypothetical protein